MAEAGGGNRVNLCLVLSHTNECVVVRRQLKTLALSSMSKNRNDIMTFYND